MLSAITSLFSTSRTKSRPHRRSPVSLRVEGLETRDVPASLGGLSVLAPVVPPAAAANPAMVFLADTARSNSLGQGMANYLQSQVNAGRRVGGGECAHLATEALRAAGADFTRTEPEGTKDYVWSSNRVARLTHGSQVAGKRFQVGDILQYHNATFSVGGGRKYEHHTQVVAAVDSNGRITQVYEQNVNGNRTAQRRAIIDLTKLTGGSVTVYRAAARTSQTGLYEYSIVNNTNASRTYTLRYGSNTSTKTLSRVNTEDSYRVAFVRYTGATPRLSIGNSSVAIQNGAAYELYTMSNGQVGIRKM